MKQMFWQIVALVVCSVALLSFSAHAQNAALGGFTPNSSVSINFPKSTYPMGATAPAEIAISGSPNGKYLVFVKDEAGNEVGRIELEIGGAPGSNRGTVPIVLPNRRGEVTYTASFTINNTTPTDDATLNLENDSSVKLAVYRKAADVDDYAAVSGAAGGTLYGALEVKVHEGSHVRSSKALVRFEETEKVNGTAHAADQSHVDVEVKFNEAAGWQKQSGAGAWEPSSEAPTSAPAKGGRYRYLLNWNTASAQSGVRLDGAGAMISGKLLGHNGAHEVSLVAVDGAAGAKVAFVSAGGGAFDVAAPEKAKVEVANLVIKSVSTSNGTQDYFKFDPDSDDDALTHPTITFEIEDKGDKHRYQWYLWAKPTRSDELNSVAFTGIMPSDGSKTVTINAASPQRYTQEHPLTQWGTYTFDLRVKEIKASSEEGIGEPLVDLRSTKLAIPQHNYEVRMNEDNGEMKAVVSYTLQSARAASEGKVAFLDAKMQEKTSVPMQLQPNTLQDDVELYTFSGDEKTSDTQQDATYRAIFTATDDFATEYRDHKNRGVVVNKKKAIPVFHAEDDWMSGFQSAAPSNGHPNYGGPLQPQVGGVRPRKAFFQAGWLLATRVNSPDQVNPDWCREVPRVDTFNSFEDATNFANGHFDYIGARNAPNDLTRFVFYRYIYVLGCNSIAYSSPNEVLNVWGRASRSDVTPPERMTFIGVGDILWSKDGYDQGPNWDLVQKVTIHELGHQFLPSGKHDHGYDNPNTTVKEGEATEIEIDFYDRASYDPQALKALKWFRTFAAQSGQSVGNRDSYLLCVMEPYANDATNDWRFCGYHRDKISKYNWPIKAD